MKKVMLSMALIAFMGLSNCKNGNQTTTEKTSIEISNDAELTVTTFGVRGNCGMCKTTIEKAAKSIDGVANASWDVAKKSIKVSFEEARTTEMEIHKAIAQAGYDTEKMMGNKEAYQDLPTCCLYDHEMEMNQ